ncbi:MAG: mannose-1-phosphate guanylyltransferase [Chloroflexota bacterium]
MNYAVILAGGVGTRLWPRSRQAHPKQFSDITGSGRTMIQETVDRLDGVVPVENIYVITGERYAELAATQLPDLPVNNIIVEPYGRNTGPAIGLACVHLYLRDEDAVVAFLHADQAIPQLESFQQALRRAFVAAQADHLTTLGITPTFPHTGFGYIRHLEEVSSVVQNGLPIYSVDSFLEKPDLPTAQAFLSEGSYFWNGGMFICRVQQMRAEFQRQLPIVYQLMEQIESTLREGGPRANIGNLWDKMPKISIDHGIMEGAQNVAVVPLDAGWNDVGSWDSIEAVRKVDTNGNCIASGEALSLHSHGSIVYSNKLVALIGVENLVVVETDDALLIGRKDQMQKVKNVVEQLQSEGRSEYL